VRRVDDSDELEAALEEALRFGEHVLVERWIEGRELHVVVLGGRVLGSCELSHGDDVYRGRSDLYLPPRLSPERLRGVHALAERAVAALDAAGLVEVDLMVQERGNELLLELDTQPALAPASPAVRVAAAAGLDLGTLAEELLREAALHAPRRAGRTLELSLQAAH
jgi:D-alanine-D-alanine ligase